MASRGAIIYRDDGGGHAKSIGMDSAMSHCEPDDVMLRLVKHLLRITVSQTFFFSDTPSVRSTVLLLDTFTANPS